MRKIVLLFLILASIDVSAQFAIAVDSVKKPGIYRSFKDFTENNPSISLEGKVINKLVKYGDLFTGSKKMAYALDVDKDKGRDIGDVFGFCDGNNIYLIASDYTDVYFPNKIHNFNFYKVEYIGRYTYYEAIQNSGPNMGRMATLDVNVIDMLTGNMSVLTKKYLKEIIKDNLQLTEKFRNQENKYAYLKDYLQEYLKK